MGPSMTPPLVVVMSVEDDATLAVFKKSMEYRYTAPGGTATLRSWISPRSGSQRVERTRLSRPCFGRGWPRRE